MPFMPHFSLRTSLLALFVAAGITPVVAGEGDISYRRAAAIAKQYVRLSATAQRTLKSRTLSNQTGAPYYLFNDATNNGFVLVAGNDAMGTVLAHGIEAPLDTLHAPEGLQFLLEAYRERFQTVQKLSTADRKRYFTAYSTNGTYTPVTPLLKSKWNQHYPYNNNVGGYPTGCVATAVAQIMYFHRWPEQGTGTKSYRTYEGNTAQIDFSQSRYAWNLMRDNYDRGALNDQEREAIGKLHHDIGAAVDMRYTQGASSATSYAARVALRDYFSYNVGATTKFNEGARGFVNMFYEELKNGYPVYIAGNAEGAASGHAMVVDGINSEGLLHINFGWGGAANAYYNLQSMAVGQTGSEFGGRPLNFNRQLEAVLAHPNRANDKPIPAAWAENNRRLSFTGEGTLRLTDQTKKIFPLAQGLDVLMNYFKNSSYFEFYGDVGLAIVNENDQQVALFKYSDSGSKQFFTNRYHTLRHDQLYRDSLKMHLDTRTLTPGNYSIVPMSATLNDGQLGNWVKMSLSPRMNFTVEQNQIKVTEENYPDAGYRVTGPLENKDLQVGKSTVLRIPLHSLSGITPPCHLKLEILDKNKKVLQTAQSSEINFDAFDEQNVPIVLTADEKIRTGKYNARLTLIFTDETRAPIQLTTHEGGEFFELNITEPVLAPALSLSGFGIYNGDGDLILNPYINLTRGTFAIKGRLFAAERNFSGMIEFYWEDVESGDRTEVGRFISVQMSRDYSVDMNLGFMKAQDFRVVNDRAYRLIATYMEGGKRVVIPVTDGGTNTYTFSGSTYVPRPKDNTYQPQLGDFVRIRLQSGQYLTAPSATESQDTRLSTSDGNINGTTIPSPETIFRLTGNGLITLSGGRALLHASSDERLTEGLKVALNADQPDELLFKTSWGKHTLRWFYNRDFTTSEAVVIEKINELPVLIGQFGYSTFYTPVDAVLKNAKAYGGTPQTNGLKLHELSNNIPAGTAFILSGQPNTWATLTLQEKRTFPSIADEKNVLFGYETPHKAPTDETFALSRSTGDFMRLSAWQRPFRAYLSNLDGLIGASPDGLKIGLITSTLQAKKSDEATLLFNLQGVRISKPAPGQIYLRNGKKFIAR